MELRINAGDRVCLEHQENKLYMVVGSVVDDIAECYWVRNNKIKHAKIPVITLTRLDF